MAYRVNLKYNPVTDADIIARLKAQENKQHYIRRLILADIAADHLFTLQSDIENDLYHERIEYWLEHCAAAADPDVKCDGCPYKECFFTGSDTYRCTLEDHWNIYKETLIKEGKHNG